MAKLKGPLMSFGASGAIAKTLVYFPWKGINAVRTYVVPANPKSDAQTDQRNIFTDAITEWHGAAYTAEDVGAWNRYAGILAKIMSGFNAMVRTFVKEAILGNTWTRMFGGRAAGVGTTFFASNVHKISGGLAPSTHWGKSKTHFPNSGEMVDLGNDTWFFDVTGLTKNTLYYYYMDVGESGSTYGRTGIYSQRTLAA